MNRILVLVCFLLQLGALSQSRLFGLKGSVVCPGDSIKAYSLNGGALNWMGDTSNASTEYWFKPDSSGYLKAQSEVPRGLGAELNPNAGFQLGEMGFRSTYHNPNSSDTVLMFPPNYLPKITNQGDTVITPDFFALVTDEHHYLGIGFSSE